MITLTDHYSFGLLRLGQGGMLLSGVTAMAHWLTAEISLRRELTGQEGYCTSWGGCSWLSRGNRYRGRLAVRWRTSDMKELLQGPLPALKSWAKGMENDNKPRQAWLLMAQTPEEWVYSLSQACSYNQLSICWGQRKYSLRRRSANISMTTWLTKKQGPLDLRVFLPYFSINVPGYY